MLTLLRSIKEKKFPLKFYKIFMFEIIEVKVFGKIRELRSRGSGWALDSAECTMKVLKENFTELKVEQNLEKQMQFLVLLLASSSDLTMAFQNIVLTEKNFGKRVKSYNVITPDLNPNLSNLSFDLPFHKMNIYSDQDFISNRIYFPLVYLPGLGRKKWVKQQYLKLKFVYNSEEPVLILDADTFISPRFDWLNSNSPAILINDTEFHFPYSEQVTKFFGKSGPLLNFVSHAQFQEPKYLREILGADFEKGWQSWINSGRKIAESSPVSEFQTYGCFISQDSTRGKFRTYRHFQYDSENFSLSDFVNFLDSGLADLITLGNKKLLNSPFY
jgi:hypothetical protein